MNRLSAACEEWAARRSFESGLNAARHLKAGAEAVTIEYPTGLVMVRILRGEGIEEKYPKLEITPRQYRYLLKWDCKIGPNFPLA